MNEPEVVEALRLGKPIESELSVFMKACPARVVGITGTRGKSTTTSLIHALLSADKKRKVWLGGNILVSPLTFLSAIKKNDIVVLEMSSFQLEGTGFAGVSPQVAVWTNLLRDHLNAYPGMAEYAEAKAQIFRHQQPDDVVFLPADKIFNEYATSAPGRVVRVGKKGSAEAKIVRSSKLRLLGEHNRRNAEFAVAVALEFGVSLKAIRHTLGTFVGLPHRLEDCGVKKGIHFVNDSAATTPDGTIAALRAIMPLTKHIGLILGGSDKELEFEELAKVVRKIKPMISLLPGTAHAKMSAALNAHRVKYTDVSSLAEAVRLLLMQTEKGDSILLSPGCTSFGLFKNEFDRGDQFKKIVKKIR